MKRSIIILTVICLCVFLLGGPGLVIAGDTAQEKKNMECVKRLIHEGYNKGEKGVVDEFVASGFKSYWNDEAEEKTGPAVIKENIDMNRGRFDNFKILIDDILAKGDKVVMRWTFKGKHKISGSQVNFKGVFIGTFSGGKLVEGRQVYDRSAQLRQLGYSLVPPDWAKQPKK